MNFGERGTDSLERFGELIAKAHGINLMRQAPIDPDFSALMGGFEAQDSLVVRELWKLSRTALDMGLESAFEIEDNEAVLKEL